jgi:hypothetical protein
MAKTYYTYRIRVANRDRVQVEKWDAQHQDQGQPSGAFRYQEKLAQRLHHCCKLPAITS